MKTNKNIVKKLFSLQTFLFVVLPFITLLLIIVHSIRPVDPYPTDVIYKQISVIKSSFHPEGFSVEVSPWDFSKVIDTNDYKELHWAYQSLVLGICEEWIRMDNISFTEQDVKESSLQINIEQYKNGSIEMIQAMQGVVSLGSLFIETANITYNQSVGKRKNDDFYNPDKPYNVLRTKLSFKELKAAWRLNRAEKLIKRGKTKRGLRIMERLKGDKKYFSVDEEFFDYCIKVNSLCESYIKWRSYMLHMLYSDTNNKEHIDG